MAEIDNKSLRVGGAFLVSGNVLQALIAFGVNLVLVRYLLPEDFGRFALVFAAASLIYGLVSLRINVLIIRAPEERFAAEDRERYFAALLLETLVATAVVLGWLYLFTDPTGWELALVLAIGLRHWTDHNKAFFERSMPYKSLATVETGASTGSHLLSLVLVLSGVGAIVLFIREIFLSLVTLIGLYLIGGLTFMKLRFPTIAEMKRIVGEAKGIWLDGVLEGSFQQVTILLAGHIGGERIAGFFFQAQRLAAVPQQFLAPIVIRLAANWFGRTENPPDRQRGRDKLLLVLAGPLIIAGMMTFWLADPIVPWLFGANWAQTAVLFQAMAGAVIFISLFEVLKVFCWTTNQTKVLLGGRFAQYTGLFVLTGAGFQGYVGFNLGLSWGLSAAYALAFAVMFLSLRAREK